MIYEYTETKTIHKEVEIKPCPFCGSENVKPIHHSGSYGYSSSEDYVKCLSCGASGGIFKDDNCGNHMREAIKKWNRRTFLCEK